MLSMQSVNGAVCEIVKSGAYSEKITLKSIPLFPGEFEFRVTSTLATARNPDEAQVRYRTTLTRDTLVRIRQAIDEVLADQRDNTRV